MKDMCAPIACTAFNLDREPGDRASDCHGCMDPFGVGVRKNGEWADYTPMYTVAFLAASC